MNRYNLYVTRATAGAGVYRGIQRAQLGVAITVVMGDWLAQSLILFHFARYTVLYPNRIHSRQTTRTTRDNPPAKRTEGYVATFMF